MFYDENQCVGGNVAVFCVAGNGGEAVKTPGTGIAGLMAMVANGVTKQRNAAER